MLTATIKFADAFALKWKIKHCYKIRNQLDYGREYRLWVRELCRNYIRHYRVLCAGNWTSKEVEAYYKSVGQKKKNKFGAGWINLNRDPKWWRLKNPNMKKETHETSN